MKVEQRREMCAKVFRYADRKLVDRFFGACQKSGARKRQARGADRARFAKDHVARVRDMDSRDGSTHGENRAIG